MAVFGEVWNMAYHDRYEALFPVLFDGALQRFTPQRKLLVRGKEAHFNHRN